MEPRTLHFAAAAAAARIVNAGGELVFTRVVTDSRAVQTGDLFVALPGETFDGHAFLQDVFARGAAAALVQEDRVPTLPPGGRYLVAPCSRTALGQIAAAYRAQFNLPAIAIGGSNGKTTTKELAASVLRQKLSTLWSEASFNNDIGVPLTLLRLENHHQTGVFEVGTNHPGELAPLLKMIQPLHGIITSIGREHLEFFNDLNGVIREEGALAEALPAHGRLFLNGDSHGCAELAARTDATVVTVGTKPGNTWRITSARFEETGSTFHLESPDADYSGTYHTHLLGMHQTVNASFAVCLGKELGLGRADIQRGLDSCTGAKMRLQLRRIDDFILIDDSYNANADSVQAALDTLARFPCTGRRVAILGDMAELGSYTDMAHKEIGVVAAQKNVDCLITIGERSRSTAEAARAAGISQVESFQDLSAALELLRTAVRPKDVVLVKASRSSRLERVVDDLQQHFNTPAPVSAG